MGVGSLVLGAIKYLAFPESRMAYRAHRTDGWTTGKMALRTLSLPKAQRDAVIFGRRTLIEREGRGKFRILPRPEISDARTALAGSQHNVPLVRGPDTPGFRPSFGVDQGSIFRSAGGNNGLDVQRDQRGPAGAELVRGPNTISGADQAPLAPQHLIIPGEQRLANDGVLIGGSAGGGLDRFHHSIFDTARSTPWYVPRFKPALGADMVTGPNTAEPVRTSFKITPKELGNRESAARKEWLNFGSTWFLYSPIAVVRMLIADARNLFRRSS